MYASSCRQLGFVAIMGGSSLSTVPLNMVVLRLMIEEPDSRSGLTARVKHEFASARWSRSAVHNACDRLVLAGRARPLDRDVGRDVVRLEATRDGRAYYEKWRRDTARGRLRDNVSARIRLCRSPEEARDLVVWLRMQEDSCDEEQAGAKESLMVHTHRVRRRRGGDRDDFAAVREEWALVDEVVRWEFEADRISRLRQNVEAWLLENLVGAEMEEPGRGRSAAS